MKTRLAVIVAVLFLLQTAVIADESKSSPKPELTQTHQYIISMMGARIGWQKSLRGKAELDAVEYEFFHEEMFCSISRSFDDRAFTTNATLDVWAKANGAPVKSVSVAKDAQKTEIVVVNYHDDKAVITTTIDEGKPREVVLEYGEKEVNDADEVFYEMNKAGKWKAGLEHSFFTVDSESQAIVKESWTVIGKSSQLLLDETTVEGMKVVVTSNGQTNTIIVDDEGEPLYLETSSGIAQEFVKKIPDPFHPERVMIETTMRSNLALSGERELAELELMFDWKHDDAAEDIPQIMDANDYHDVARLEKGFAARLKGQQLPKDFELAYPLTNIPDDIKPYLAATPHCQSDDETLSAKGVSLAKGKKDARKVAEKIVSFVRSRLKGASGASGNASAKQAYDEKTGDCTEHSALFVALARAAGLPARNIGGIVYIYDGRAQRGIFGYHAWSEVWLGEWVPVDATVNEVGTSARYIMFEINEPGKQVGKGRTSRCLRQRIKPKIVGYKKTTGKKWRKKGLTEFEYKSSD
ncbi:MAG: transglutaminase-like domain-containing protein [Planctomycetota bacterium]|jgi:hypothetical protein